MFVGVGVCVCACVCGNTSASALALIEACALSVLVKWPSQLNDEQQQHSMHNYHSISPM